MKFRLDPVVCISTTAVDSDAGGLPIGRLYGVHATRVSEPYVTTDGRSDGGSGFTQFGDRFRAAGDRWYGYPITVWSESHGLTLVTSPSCVEDEEPSTEIILNLTRSVDRPGAPIGPTRIERKRGELVPGQLDEDFVSEGLSDIAIKIKPPPMTPGAAAQVRRFPPFRAEHCTGAVPTASSLRPRLVGDFRPT